jgi:hypothetical protein
MYNSNVFSYGTPKTLQLGRYPYFTNSLFSVKEIILYLKGKNT